LAIVLLNTAYFPSVSWWAAACLGQGVLVYSQERYQKQSFRNRTWVLTANGVLGLTVPVNHGANQLTTGHVEIDPGKKWRINHWRTLCSAYNQSPYFQYIKDDLEALLFKEQTSLFALNQSLVQYFLKIMKLPVQVSDTLSATETGFDAIDLRSMGKKSGLTQKFRYPRYQQVFGQNFVEDLSIVDLFSCLGPESKAYLMQVAGSFNYLDQK
jgi:hypothetical protein